MSGLVDFMNTGVGRGIRVLLGLVLIYVGLTALSGVVGWVVALIGLLPIAMGAWGHCLLEFLMPKATHA